MLKKSTFPRLFDSLGRSGRYGYLQSESHIQMSITWEQHPLILQKLIHKNMYARTLIFVLRALQNQLQIQILHKILIYFKKKIIKNAYFFPILQHFSVPFLVACTLSNAWNP